MHHPTDRITHTTAFVTPIVEHWLKREIDQWVHHKGSIRRPIAPSANALTTELHLATSFKQKQHIICRPLDLRRWSIEGTRRSSMVERPLMVRQVVGLIPWSSQNTTTDITNAVVCVILSVGWCIYIYTRSFAANRKETGADGAVVMSLANRLVGTGLASRYRLQSRAGF